MSKSDIRPDFCPSSPKLFFVNDGDLNRLSAALTRCYVTSEWVMSGSRIINNEVTPSFLATINHEPEGGWGGGGRGVGQSKGIWLWRVSPEWAFWSFDLSITKSRREKETILSTIIFSPRMGVWKYVYLLMSKSPPYARPSPPPPPSGLTLIYAFLANMSNCDIYLELKKS